jgi:hypothetical protein
MTAPAYLPDSGDLIWTDFDPTRGREQAAAAPLWSPPRAPSPKIDLEFLCEKFTNNM